jgi:phage tail-like protein
MFLPNIEADALTGFRFVVTVGAVVMGFKSVSGITRKIEILTYQEGGVNDYVHTFAKPSASEGVLILEKGVHAGVYHPFYMVGEPLGLPLILIVNDHTGFPEKTYSFMHCMVKSWSVSDLDAQKNEVLIDKFEVAYSNFIIL